MLDFTSAHPLCTTGLASCQGQGKRRQ